MPRVGADTRRDEIIEACSRIYQVKGFNEVTIKAIAELTSFSRPSIYNYFETKEEIFLALLTRECERWADKLEALPQEAGPWDRVRFTDSLASTLDDQEVMLRIQTMNLYEIEEKSRLDFLRDYKRAFRRSMEAMDACLKTYKAGLTEEEASIFRYAFFPFLYGIYAFAHPTAKQLEAMADVGIKAPGMTIHELARRCIYKLLPDV